MNMAPRTGTVTLLFTDVEGSTRLLRELRDGYSEVIADHQRLLRQAFALHGGREVDTQGDAFFAVFDAAGDAIAAAVEALRALADTQVRVRIGIHTGEPETDGSGYVGLPVHRAARICAAANGRQILMAQATRFVVGDHELPGTMIRDLGEHALKDFERPEHLYQVIVDELAADLRPIRTLDAQEPEAVTFEAAESRLTAALEDALSPGLTSRRHRSDRQSLDPRKAITRFVRSPFEILAVALIALLGIATSSWLFIAAATLAAAFVLRHAVTERRRVADAAGIHLYAMRSLAPDAEFAEQIRQLGTLLVRGAHLVHDADRRLAASDRRVLAQRLVAARETAVSAGDARRVDALARAIESRDRLAERSRHLAHQIRRVDAQYNELRSVLFEIRLGHKGRNEVLDKVISLHADVEDAAAELKQELEQTSAPTTSGTTRRRARGPLPLWHRRWDESRTPTESLVVRARFRRHEGGRPDGS
jgi:class 3 adenylate cyclase